MGAPISLDQLFVPGVRRGYAILPIDERLGEPFEARRQRIQDVIGKVRAANVQLGTHYDGGNRHVWIAMSQPPDRCGKARLAAKVKRLYLTMGGDKDSLEMEYSSGSAWINGNNVCSATAGKIQSAEDAGPGWVDIGGIARALHVDRSEVELVWSPLKAEIN